MTANEVKTLWRDSTKDAAMVEILSQLLDCSTKELKEMFGFLGISIAASPESNVSANESRILDLHYNGLSSVAIANVCGVSDTRVSNVLKKYGKTANGKRVINDIVADQIKTLNKLGLNDCQIARQLSLKRTTVVKFRHDNGIDRVRRNSN